VPRAPEGNLFKRAWFAGKLVNAPPSDGVRVRYWDKAASAQHGDYSVGVLLGFSAGQFYVIDVIRGQWSSYERERVMRATAELDGGDTEIVVEQEGGSGGKDSTQATLRNLVGFSARADHPQADKWVRAQPFAARCEAGEIYLVRGAWNAAYIDELCGFPNATHDDQVDASSGAFNHLAKQRGGGYLAWLKRQGQEENEE